MMLGEVFSADIYLCEVFQNLVNFSGEGCAMGGIHEVDKLSDGECTFLMPVEGG